MRRSAKIMDDLLREVIIHGGFPMRRIDVYRLTLEETADTRTSDYFAFGPIRVVVCQPMTLTEVHEAIAECSRQRAKLRSGTMLQ
jgi:hypothetical protein